MGKKILVVSQYFYPEQFRINNICTQWHKRGYDVKVTAAVPNYPQGRFYAGYGLLKKTKENYEGVNIKRLPVIARGSNKLTLVLNYYSFVVSGFFWSHFTADKADIVFIHESSPMLQALVGVWFAKRRKIPCFIYVTDLWPENVQSAAGINNRFILNYLGGISDKIYASCDKIFVPSKSFASAIISRGVPEDKLVYWPQSAEAFYVPSKKTDLNDIPADGRFSVMFTGNMGVAQGLDILPEVAVKLKEKRIDIRFDMIGDGRYKNELINKISQLGIESSFNFTGRKPAYDIPKYLASADAALICLAPSDIYKRTIPAKTQSYFACGVPVIVSADGEVQSVVEDAKAGICAKAGSVDALVNAIEMMYNMPNEKRGQMGKNGVLYCKEYFNTDKLLDEMDTYIGQFTK